MTEQTIFQEALSRPPAERAAFLDQACAGRPEIRAAVEALLTAHGTAGPVLHLPSAELPPTRDSNLGQLPVAETRAFSLPPQLASPEATGGVLANLADPLGQTRDSGQLAPPVAETLDSGPRPGAEAAPTLTDYRPSSGPGAVIAGRYTLELKIGEGGMGEVWVARQTEPVKRKVALKLIKAGMDSKAVLVRFEQERQALALMDHPNIARVLDGGMTGQVVGEGWRVEGKDDLSGPTTHHPPPSTRSGQPFFVMELVHGQPLTKFCDEAKLTPQARLELFVPICQAVQHAHQKGIIHRDLKPANILVSVIDGRPVPKVIDFGVAKATGGSLTDASLATEIGAVIGTLEYMAPEQAGLAEHDIDTRADIYSLGVILYELLTGLRPIDARQMKRAAALEILRLLREEEPAKPSTRLSTHDALPSVAALRQTEPKRLMAMLRGELDWVVMKCLEKQRDRRYETANGLVRDIQRYLADEPVEARPPSFGYRTGKFLRRNKGPVIAASVVLLALIAGVVGTTIGLFREHRAKLEVQEQKSQAEAARDREAKERGYAEAIAHFVKDDFLALTSVEGQEQHGGDKLSKHATLRDLLDRAAKKLKECKDLDPRTEAELNWMIGISYRMSGDAALGIPFLERAAELRRGTLGASAELTLEVQNSLAVAYGKAGGEDKALPLYEETYRLTKERLGPDAALTLRYGRVLASCYVRLHKDEVALPLVDETLRRMRSQLGPDDEQTLLTLQTQATLYQHKGNTKEAIAVLQEGLKLAKPRHGADHPITYEIMNNLAVLYLERGQAIQAAPLFEEVLKIAKKRLEPDHPDIFTITNNLLTTYRSTGKRDLELAMRKEMLDLLRVKLGPDHPDTITQMNNLGTAFLYAQKAEQALPLLEEGVQRATAKWGPNDPRTFTASNNLANAYADTGKLEQAIPLFEESLKLTRDKLGPDHFATLHAMNNLGDVYREAGKLGRAVEMLEEAARRGKAHLGIDHLVTRSCLKNLAASYMASGEDAKLVSLLPEFLPGFRTMFAANRQQLAGGLAELGLFLLEHKRWAEAEPLVRECLAIREKTQPDAWTTFNAQSLLGGVLLGQKKYAEAEPLLLQGYEGMKKREKSIPPQGSTRIPEALDRLIELYTAFHKPDEAKKWRAERAKYPEAKKAAALEKK
jgi:serine/threonine protein kinase